MQGIVTMPSYHTVMAVLFTYAFRGTGLIGYGIATLNLVMLLSIPPIGGHYLVDMLAGGALALGAIAVQRAPRHGVSRILFGLRRETLVGKVLDSAAAPFSSLSEFRREHLQQKRVVYMTLEMEEFSGAASRAISATAAKRRHAQP